MFPQLIYPKQAQLQAALRESLTIVHPEYMQHLTETEFTNLFLTKWSAAVSYGCINLIYYCINSFQLIAYIFRKYMTIINYCRS